MSKSTKSTKSLPADAVRTWYADARHGAKRLAALSPEGRISVAPRGEGEKPLRGRIGKEAAEHFNKTTVTGVYFTGNTKAAVADAMVEALTARVKAFEAGAAVGARGPLNREARIAAGLPVPPVKTRKASPKSRKGK